MLLEQQDIDPKTIDTRHNPTPLLLAAGGGREGMVKSLLAQEDVNPNILDTRCGRAPLGCATVRGGGCTSNGNIIGTRGYQSQNCGHWIWPKTIVVGCAGRPCRDIRVATKQVDLNPDTLGFSCEIAVEYAASRGHTRVLQLLSEPKPSLPLQ